MKRTMFALALCLSSFMAGAADSETGIEDKNMENPLLCESPLPYGAVQFDKIRIEHYMPAFEAAMAEGKAEIDAITANPEPPTFANTIEAMENAGRMLNRVSGIFYNLLEADSNPEMQAIAEKLAPMMNEYSMYISLNESLFRRIEAVWKQKDAIGLSPVQLKLLNESYKDFVRGGATLSDEDKKTLSALKEELSLLTLQYSKNVLDATNAWTLDLSSEEELAGLPGFVIDMGATLAAEKGKSGWVYDLSYPSYSSFMKYSERADLRKRLYIAYNSRAFGGAYDNSEICIRIADLRLRIAGLLGYETYADYVLEDRMAGTKANVDALIDRLMEPSLPAARAEIATLLEYARGKGYTENVMQPWDFSYWSEKYKNEFYSLSDEALKPYFRLDDCIEAVFDLAGRLYGITFKPRPDLPAYHEDVRVYEVSDADGRFLALFYADFYPRASKRGGAWMTNFRELGRHDGVEERPLVSIVTNFSKPTATAPSLLTHYEFTTLLHEFGHSLHSILSEGQYSSLSGTNVAWDFVELPSQIMENWGYEPEYLKTFARDYRSGEVIPDSLIERLSETRNFQSAYAQVRQLHFGLLDMAYHAVSSPIEADVKTIETAALCAYETLPMLPECAISTSFSHIFSGGYSAGYYSYKWAEVLEADAFAAFREAGIFDREVAESFRRNILSKGSSEDEAVLYRNFRGHDPDPDALLEKLGIPYRK